MELINRFNIKFKLAILFLILCFSIAILGYTAIEVSEDNKEKLRNVHTKSQEVLKVKDDIISPLYEVRELTQSLVMAPNPSLRVDIEEQLDAAIKKLDKEFILFRSENETIYLMWVKYKKLIETTRKYLLDDFEEGAYVTVSTSNKEQFNLLISNLLQIQSFSLSNAKTAYENAVEETKALKIEILLSVGFILFLAIIIGWVVSQNIITSIHKVQSGLSEFFDFLNHRESEAKKIELKADDEFAQMAKVINANVANIQANIQKDEALIKNATRVLENIKGGNLGTRLSKDTNNSELNELKNMINTMIDNLEEQIQNEIDQRLEQEQILIQQSKLASMGEMIGNIAHQWRQPLAQISAIHMNMKVTYQFDKFTQSYLDSKIEEANKLTNYMSQTISDFQNFFNPQGEKEQFSVYQACQDAYFIIESSMKYHGIGIDFNVIEDSQVYGYKNEYSQVILNILSNAKDVLLERKIEDPLIHLDIKVGESYAIVKITDNAGGIKSDILDKIFEPYFTTRHKTQGTGIGLYMSKNIIERNMNGFINVQNSEVGACFTIKVLKNL